MCCVMLLTLRVVVWCREVLWLYRAVLCVCAFRSCTENNAVCIIKTVPCVLSKRSRVCRQNAQTLQLSAPLPLLSSLPLSLSLFLSFSFSLSFFLFFLFFLFFFFSLSLSFGREMRGPRAGSRQRQHSTAVRITVIIYTTMTKQIKL